MKKYLKFISIVYILSNCILLESCSKNYNPCEKKPKFEITRRWLIETDAYRLYPYKGNETLTFISNKGDTAVLKGKGQIFKYTKFVDMGSSSPESCTQYYHEHEIYFTEFVGNNPNFNHIGLEVFKRKDQPVLLKSYINGKTGVGDYFETSVRNLYITYRPEFSNIAFAYRDSVVSAHRVYITKSFNDPYPAQVILYREHGIIGYMPDSTTIYTLQ